MVAITCLIYSLANSLSIVCVPPRRSLPLCLFTSGIAIAILLIAGVLCRVTSPIEILLYRGRHLIDSPLTKFETEAEIGQEDKDIKTE